MGIFIHTKIRLIEKGTGAALSGATVLVRLFDKDPLADDFLGEAKPDAEGNVTIKFDIDKVKSADSPLEQFPDLYFRVYREGKEFFESPLLDAEQEGEFSFTEGEIIDLGTYLI